MNNEEVAGDSRWCCNFDCGYTNTFPTVSEHEEHCERNPMAWGNRPRRSSRIQEELEEADRDDGFNLDTYYVVKVSGDDALLNIINIGVSYYLHVLSGGERYAPQVKVWTNPLPPYTRLNGEDPQVFWVAFPAMTDGLDECLIAQGCRAEPFNYDKYIGRLYFCTDRACGDCRESIMCPTCVRADEDRELDLPVGEGGWVAR